MYYSVGILRFGKAHDYSKVLGEDVPKHILDMPRTLMPNDSSTDLFDKVHGSMDSIERNVSQGKNLRDLQKKILSIICNPLWHDTLSNSMHFSPYLNALLSSVLVF